MEGVTEMWKKNNDGAIHALGNGRFLVYGRGNDIAEVYGPPYSSPSMLHGKWALADGADIGAHIGAPAAHVRMGGRIVAHGGHEKDRATGDGAGNRLWFRRGSRTFGHCVPAWGLSS